MSLSVCLIFQPSQLSDILAAVQFGVNDAIHGLAAMLKLVWVPTTAIKSAVVQAFRLLYLYSDDTGESRWVCLAYIHVGLWVSCGVLSFEYISHKLSSSILLSLHEVTAV